MNASPSLLQYIEQALHGLMMLLTGGILSSGTPDTDDIQILMEQALSHRPKINVLLVAESDPPMAMQDAEIIQKRLESLSFQVQLVETRDQRLNFLVTGPHLNFATMAKLFAPGEFYIGTLEESNQWMSEFSDGQMESLGIVKAQMSPAAFETLVSSNPAPLMALIPALVAANRSPFIYCQNDQYHEKGCALYTMKKGGGITNEDIDATEIRYFDEGQRLSYHITFSPEAADRFRLLTAANIKKPLPMVLDGEGLSLPIVQEVIEEDTVQVTGADNFNSNSLFDALLEAQIFFSMIGHPSLTAKWKLVHMEPIVNPEHPAPARSK